VTSRTEAQEAIAAGLVTVDGGPAMKPSTQVHPGQAVALSAPPRTYVSRGGEKLAHALRRFDVDPAGRRCLDAGVSTGGFTDCLLQHGAAHVVAYDVGYGQVHERIRTDERVDVHERTNIRDVVPDVVPPPLPDLLVCDVSFIALQTVLPILRRLGTPDAEAITLIKPQFEAARADVGKGGVVRDAVVWHRVVTEVAGAAARLDWCGVDVTASPLPGPAGNIEFLAHLTTGPAPDDLAVRIDRAVDEARALRAGPSPT
jgi:23S rRNA (cytidine1920-2'-O)/16S rRNA (cytidine1409-2'-O)-methyltransferase